MLPVHVRFSWVSCETDMCVDLGGARCAAWSLVRCCFLVFRKWFYAHNPDPLSLPRRCPLSNGGEHFIWWRIELQLHETGRCSPGTPSNHIGDHANNSPYQREGPVCKDSTRARRSSAQLGAKLPGVGWHSPKHSSALPWCLDNPC